jgi:hypothetical protein
VHGRNYLRLLTEAIILMVLVALIISLSSLEAWYLNHLLDSYAHAGGTLFSFLGAVALLFLSGFALCILCLKLAAVVPSTGFMQLVTPIVMLVSYLLIPKVLPPQPLIFLATGKVLSSLLLIRFWQAKFRVFRMRHGQSPTASLYLLKMKNFLECRWVLVGTWLLSNLAFALAMVVQQTILEMQGWEGLALMFTFFGLFWVFIRNPNAH